MYNKVIEFWFNEIPPSKWWTKDIEFDTLIKNRFLDIHSRATRCELFEWRRTAQGRLAEIIVLDQFSRNIFRGLPESFAHDPVALVLSQEAISLGIDQQLAAVERSFIYLPFMHSESIRIHEVAEKLYSQPGMESNLEWEIKHKNIIEKFGRYPHRNEILGRKSTQKEIDFLKQPGSRF